jgi:peptide/nickel transport system permease protein
MIEDPALAGTSGTPAATTLPPVPARRKGRRAFRRYCRNVPAVISAVFVLILIVVAALGDLITPYPPAKQNILENLEGPSAAHWLGTDDYGRDLLSRIMVGTRVSLVVGVLSVLIVLIIGVAIGLTAGYLRRAEGPLMRFVDICMSIPDFMLLLVLISLFGTGTYKVVLFIGLSAWMSTARLVRGQVLKLRSMEFVLASECIGSGTVRIMRKDLLRNVLDVVVVQATLTISLVILLESALSYLGIGAQPPTPSWGNMLSQGADYLSQAWWIATFPGIAIFLTVMSFNFIGDGIRDALDVRM